MTEENPFALSSITVAQRFGMLHKEILRVITGLKCSDGFREKNFKAVAYTSNSAADKSALFYLMTHEGYAYVAMSLSGGQATHFKEALAVDIGARIQDVIKEGEVTSEDVPRKKTDDTHNIYFIQNEETRHIKIGRTTGNPAKRVAQIRGMAGAPCRLLAVLYRQPGHVEKQYHQQFADLHCFGEWFKPGEALVKHIESLDRHRTPMSILQ